MYMKGKEIDTKVANALMTVFDKNRIYHDDLPEDGDYPVIQYTDIDENPVIFADGELYGYEHDIRITIVTKGNDKINDLKEEVYKCMTDAGFIWTGTDKIRYGAEYYTTMDFTIEVWIKD